MLSIDRTNWKLGIININILTIGLVLENGKFIPLYFELLNKRKIVGIDYQHYIEEKEKISKMNAEVNELLKAGEEAAKLEREVQMKVTKQRLDHELKTNQSLLNNIAQKQEALAKIQLDKWYNGELNKVNSSVNISGNNSTNLDNTHWEQKHSDTEWLFQGLGHKKLIKKLKYIKNNRVFEAEWRTDKNNKTLTVKALKGAKEFIILEFTDEKLSLKEKKNGDIVELYKFR